MSYSQSTKTNWNQYRINPVKAKKVAKFILWSTIFAVDLCALWFAKFYLKCI